MSSKWLLGAQTLLVALFGLLVLAGGSRPDRTASKERSIPDAGSTSIKTVRPPALDWESTTAGGVLRAGAAGLLLSASVGQAAVGSSSGGGFQVGSGFWAGVTAASCPVAITGDVNVSGTITAGDVIYVVNYVFKAGPAPLPCAAAGDANCSGGVSASDIIYLVNFVFKAGPAPCDVCAQIGSTWSCP